MATCEHLTEGTLLQGGKYRIAQFIGAGGFGCTYMAEHQPMGGAALCIKELYVQDFCGRDATGRVSILTESRRGLVEKLKKKFLDEASALFKFNHPGIVKVHDIFEENGTAYFTMDYIDGMTLKEMVEKFGPLSEADALEFISQAAGALEYVHSKNRLHLDIKPANIMVAGDGEVKLIDFGVSKQYDEVDGQNTSTLMGYTEGYAPPEQMTRRVTQFYPATDIYSLGATLYYLLTGVTPPSANELISGEAEIAALPDTISRRTRSAIEAAMRLTRKDRPQSIADWLKMLNGNAKKDDPKKKVIVKTKDHPMVKRDVVVKDVTDIDNPDNPAPPTPNTASKRKLWPWIVGVAAAAVAIIIIIAASGNDSENKAPLTADNQMAADSVIVANLADDDGMIAGEVIETVEQIAGPVTTPAAQEQPKTKQTPAAPAQQAPQETKIEHLTRLANSGDANAQYELGKMYFYGNGVPIDYAQAAEWYRKAAEQGIAAAQYGLGCCLESGEGVPKDYSQAAIWYKKAADQGHTTALYRLGKLYYEGGPNLPQNKEYGLQLIRQAANAGHYDAKSFLRMHPE